MAHWFYTDEYVPEASKLRNCSMNEFAKHMFNHIPFLRKHSDSVDEILENWRQYKISVPTYGAVILNQDLTQVILVQSYWNKTSWGFPKGKVNEEEAPHLCAVREVLEETGFSIADRIDPEQYAETTVNDQTSRLFFIPHVPMNTVFSPKTKYEIRDIQWFPLDLLPASKKDPIPDSLNLKYNSLYMVMPFVRSIRKWVATQKRGGRRRSTQPSVTPNPQNHHKQKHNNQHHGKENQHHGQQSQHHGQQNQHHGQQSQHQNAAAFGTMDYMPKAWTNFSVKRKDLYQAMDQVLQ